MGWDSIVSEDGFVSLFNGLDLQGWNMAGRGKGYVFNYSMLPLTVATPLVLTATLAHDFARAT